MMPAHNELRIFISSTFRDMQEEREHLVKKIFPEIRSLCRERGITFTEIDLRWGLTDEDVVLGQVVRTCLEEIDKCRPYFIGLVGERYGWAPPLHEFYKDPELFSRWPWLEDAAMEESSITDIEFRHAALNVPSLADHARFFFRRQRRSLGGGEDGTTENEGKVKLEDLKARVRDAGLSVEEFRDPGSLGELVYDQLIEIIERDFADAKPPTPLEEERSKHAAFAASRRRAYIPNPEHLKRLNAWVADEDAQPLIVYAESGSGKSSLVSFWCDQLRRRQPQLHIVEHYVGIGAGDSDHLGIIRHVMEEIRERYERSEVMPSKPEDLEHAFANWLGYNVGAPMLLVVDGINQLTGRALDLYWLPPVMPPGVKLIISSTVEQTLVGLRRRGWSELGMQPLSESEREAVVVRFLAEYGKALSPDQVRRVASDVKCAHPLFLRTLLEEVRLHGMHEHLDRTLDALLSTTGTEDLFQRVLERLEDDYGTRSVRDVLSLIWASRGGLSEEDLESLTGIARLKLSTLLLGLDYHLVRRDGLLSFFHDYLRRAVQKRYLVQLDFRAERYRMLVEHFERSEMTLRANLELLSALESLGDRERMQDVLTDLARFIVLWDSEEQEVLRLWSSMDLTELVGAYEAGLERWERQERTPGERVQVLGRIGVLYDRVAAWSAAEQLERGRLALVRERGDRRAETAVLTQLANLALQSGRREEAEQLSRESERLARELGDLGSIAVAVSNRGNVHAESGEYPQALACYEECEQLSRELGDRRGIAVAVGNSGRVHADRSEFPEALACYREQEQIARDLGDRRSIGLVVGNRGRVHAVRGDYSEALACFRECEQIARELGDRRGIAFVVGNRGTVHMDRGEYSDALACFGEQEQIARELGDRASIAVAVGNRGLVHEARGEYSDALACNHEQELLGREMGDRSIIANSAGNRGLVHAQCGEYATALACYWEQEQIARELGDRRAIGIAVGNRGIAHADCREYLEALECFEQAANEHRDIGFRYGLTYWLAGVARVLLELVEDREPAPEYLRQFISSTEPSTWQVAALRTARDHAAECVEISQELSKPDTVLRGRVLLARVAAADGDAATAREQLRDMLAQPRDDEQRADLHYWLWKLGDITADHLAESLRLYNSLIAIVPKHLYRQRIDELDHATKPTTPETDDAAT